MTFAGRIGRIIPRPNSPDHNPRRLSRCLRFASLCYGSRFACRPLKGGQRLRPFARPIGQAGRVFAADSLLMTFAGRIGRIIPPP